MDSIAVDYCDSSYEGLRIGIREKFGRIRPPHSILHRPRRKGPVFHASMRLRRNKRWAW